MGAAELLAKDRFAVSLGVRLVEDAPHRLVVEMELNEEHRAGDGGVDHGVVFSLADCAMSLISNRDSSAVAVATHLTTGVSPPGEGTLRAVATPASFPPSRAVTWQVLVTAGDVLVANFTGTTLRVGGG
ncbi:MAG: hypothetical protein WB239_13430 [Acidimicrobiia bacterium]